MPPLERTDLLQRAVWFATNGVDSYGQWTYAAPQEIPCRWIQKRSIIQDHEGNNLMLDATVIVNQNVTNGDLMWLGSLDNWNDAIDNAGSGQTPSEVMQVKSYDWTPDIKARNQRRELGLMRYREKIAHA